VLIQIISTYGFVEPTPDSKGIALFIVLLGQNRIVRSFTSAGPAALFAFLAASAGAELIASDLVH
jgi:hypothetical protein